MSLSTQLNDTLEHLLLHQKSEISNEQLVRCIDLTLLKEDASTDSLKDLNKQAHNEHVAAICVLSQHLPLFKPGTDVFLATVVNFSQGRDEVETSLLEIEQAIALGVQEIDYVLPYHDYLAGKTQEALNKCAQIAQYCNQQQLCLKIIIETGAFSELNSLYQVARELIDLNVNFLKTSTGKITQGASLSTVFALLSALKDANTECGIKISGGVKTTEQARSYASLAALLLNKKIDRSWFRLGASSLLAELVKN